MTRLPPIGADDVLRVLRKLGFYLVRQRGSHVRLKHDDGRVVTVPVHRGRQIGQGLLRKILRDAELSREEFIRIMREGSD